MRDLPQLPGQRAGFFSVRGMDKLARKLGKMERAVERKLARRATQKAARAMRDDLKLAAPRETGRLQKAIVSRERRFDPIFGYGSSVYVTKGNGARHDAWYWRLVEFGTGQHRIEPKKVRSRKAALADGQQVYGSAVRHPGISARGFMRRVWMSRQRAYLAVMVKTLRTGIREVSRR